MPWMNPDGTPANTAGRPTGADTPGTLPGNSGGPSGADILQAAYHGQYYNDPNAANIDTRGQPINWAGYGPGDPFTSGPGSGRTPAALHVNTDVIGLPGGAITPGPGGTGTPTGNAGGTPAGALAPTTPATGTTPGSTPSTGVVPNNLFGSSDSVNAGGSPVGQLATNPYAGGAPVNGSTPSTGNVPGVFTMPGSTPSTGVVPNNLFNTTPGKPVVTPLPGSYNAGTPGNPGAYGGNSSRDMITNALMRRYTPGYF